MALIQLLSSIGLIATLVYGSATYGVKAGLLTLVALLCNAIGTAAKDARRGDHEN